MSTNLSTTSHQLSAIMLALLLAFGSASGQTPARSATALQAELSHKPRMTEPLEKPAMPPAYIYRLESSPRMISRFGLFTCFQVNVDASGNNILGAAANDPSI